METYDPVFQNFSTVQSDKQPTPATVASADEVIITTGLTFITGTTTITHISGRTRTDAEVAATASVPPISGYHMLVFIFTNANPGGVGTGGNIYAALDPAQNQPMLLFYDPVAKLYRAGVLALS
jgi:hypothetical protein